MSIKVSVNPPATIKVRVGQAQATKVVSSSSLTSGNLSSINDISTGSRGLTNSGPGESNPTFTGSTTANTILMYNTTTNQYEHVSPYMIVDMADSVQDQAQDAGTW
tara:strand:+ start:1240 stop:1557 length:318 start_codon:yes stop_codon:yes gene_type:complete